MNNEWTMEMDEQLSLREQEELDLEYVRLIALREGLSYDDLTLDQKVKWLNEKLVEIKEKEGS